MPIYVNSRYARVETISIEAEDGELAKVYELPQTTILEAEMDPDTELYTVSEGETFETIAYREYSDVGGVDIAWVLAMHNPHVFYPLDLSAGTVIYLPPPHFIERFLLTQDDWEETWESVIK